MQGSDMIRFFFNDVDLLLIKMFDFFPKFLCYLDNEHRGQKQSEENK